MGEVQQGLLQGVQVTDQPKIRRRGNEFVEYDEARKEWVPRKRQKNTLQRLFENDRIDEREWRAGNYFHTQYQASLYGARYTLPDADQILKDPDQRAGKSDYTPHSSIDADKFLKECERELGPKPFSLLAEICGMEKTTREATGLSKNTAQSHLLKALFSLAAFCEQKGVI